MTDETRICGHIETRWEKHFHARRPQPRTYTCYVISDGPCPSHAAYMPCPFCGELLPQHHHGRYTRYGLVNHGRFDLDSWTRVSCEGSGMPLVAAPAPTE